MHSLYLVMITVIISASITSQILQYKYVPHTQHLYRLIFSEHQLIPSIRQD